MKKSTRFCAVLTALALVLVMLIAMTGCANTGNSNNTGGSANEAGNSDTNRSTYPTQIYDKHGNPVQMPSDNDEEGWFSVEVVNQYSAASFTQPEGTTVVSKPEPNALYLQGGSNTFRDTVAYAFAAINASNSDVFLPVLGIGEDSVATVTALDRITHVDIDSLYPKGDVTSVKLIYKSGHKAYECSISLENNNQQVYIAFADRTELYGHLM